MGWLDVGSNQVDMPIGSGSAVVAVHPIRQPDHLGRVIGTQQRGLDLCLGHARVAIGIEQALFGGNERALPIGNHRATFKHHIDW
ncbi:hypothetical protein D9M71_567690 [compost metagenome]